MTESRFNQWLGLVLILCFFAASTGVRCATKDASPDSEIRHLHFPPNVSLGPLLILKPQRDDPNSWEQMFDPGKTVGGARGDVTVTIPSHNLLILDANGRVFEKPALLKMVSPFGIDVLRIRFYSLADSEDHLLDGTFDYVNHLEGLQMLDVDSSDISDANLSKLKGMSHLRTISCYNTTISGDCFKDLATLPALTELLAPDCLIKESNLKNLQKFPRLSILDLAGDGRTPHSPANHLTQRGVQEIAKCHGIVNLNVRDQIHFDDSCLKYLATMKNLRYLYLTGTPITFNGLSALRGLGLKYLALPSTCYKNSAEVARMFPHALCKIAQPSSPQTSRLNIDDPKDRDLKVLFSPLR